MIFCSLKKTIQRDKTDVHADITNRGALFSKGKEVGKHASLSDVLHFIMQFSLHFQTFSSLHGIIRVDTQRE